MGIQLNRKVKAIKIESTDESLTALPLTGEWTVLYFYPKDNTSGCTQEAIDFSEAISHFKKCCVRVVGVSRESISSHVGFIKKADILFPLISDPDEILCQYFGVMKEKSMYGKKYWGIERSTFLIDPEGILKKEWRKVKVTGHVEALLSACSDMTAVHS